MLTTDIITVANKAEFDRYTKKYFVNMCKNIRTLHITNNSKCHYSDFAIKFIPFSSLEEVAEYEVAHSDATPFRRCGNCFRKPEIE